MKRPSAMPLTEIHGQIVRVTDLLSELAGELSSVNSFLKVEIANRRMPAAVAEALKKSTAVESRVQEASRSLVTVNQSLASEIRDRTLVNLELDATREQHAASNYAALHDDLTGLATRALFEDRVEHGIALARRHEWSLAVMFIDLDKFKGVNDTHGHEVGDAVLRTVAQRLTAVTRGDDTVSRIGGDEFLYLETEVRDEGSIVTVARKLLAAIRAPIDILIHDIDLSIRIDASIGISIYPKHGDTSGVLIECADHEMYRAKQNGTGFSLLG